MSVQKGWLLLLAGILFTSIQIASAESDARINSPNLSAVSGRHLRMHNVEPAKPHEDESDTEERGRFNAEAVAKAFAIDAKKIDDVVSKMEIEMVNLKYKPLKYLGLQNLRNFEGDSSQLVKLATRYFSSWKNSKYDATKIREEMAAAGITDETAIQNVQKWFDIFVKKVKDS
ncbi:hypothetical protein L917_06907 [Phytophthora nicotianae]|uniref:RxLR effector protein n=1 Tax=Phytophthora nicotianae TaxID=4792 RepID=W2LD04_PHYNI|nr:hypothetical protein L917_06907 [Phytophthora nicotianae]